MRHLLKKGSQLAELDGSRKETGVRRPVRVCIIPTNGGLNA